MISPSPPSHWLCRRRAFARISSMPTSLESSTHSGAAASRWEASRIFGQRCSATRPLRSSSPLIRAWEATKRWASSASAISSENSATGRGAWCSTAAFSAMLQTSALLPIAGRAAMMIRLPGWKPPVISSRSLKPEGVPVSDGAFEREPVQLVELLVQDLLDRAEVLLAVVAGDLEHRLLGLLDELPRGGARGRGRSPGSRRCSAAAAAGGRSRARSARSAARGRPPARRP